MRFILAVLCIFSFSFISHSQSYRLNMGQDIKLKKGTTDLDIIYSDNTGLYFSESKLAMKTYFVIGATFGTSQTLMKFDKNSNEIFSKEYKKELKGLSFHSFQVLENEIFMFATDYIKKERLFKVFGTRIDKSSGELLGDFIELGNYTLESKKDDYEMRLKTIRDGNNFLMVSNITSKEHVSLGINLLSKTLKSQQQTVIDLPLTSKEFSLQDVQFTTDKKIIVLGKQFEETQIGKKKKKRMVFKRYAMMAFNPKGKKEADIDLNTGERFIIGGQLVEEGNGSILLAGFYSNTAKKEDLAGFFINKVDPRTGQMTLASYKEINSSMLGQSFTDEGDEDDETKANKKQLQKVDEDDVDEFPNEFVIKSVNINPADSSILITSEITAHRHYEFTSFDHSGRTPRTTHTEVDVFTNKDILIISSDKNGQIRWLNAIHKSQNEQIRSSSSSRSGLSFNYSYTDFFAQGGGLPYYSSYISVLQGNTLHILLNDHTNNTVNPKYGDKVKTVYNFKKKSSLYGISIDLTSGDMKRKFIAESDKEIILMPRHGYVYKNEVIIPSWRMRALAKTELKFGRITIK